VHPLSPLGRIAAQALTAAVPILVVVIETAGYRPP
jgi:hypothetical protein